MVCFVFDGVFRSRRQMGVDPLTKFIGSQVLESTPDGSNLTSMVHSAVFVCTREGGEGERRGE